MRALQINQFKMEQFLDWMWNYTRFLCWDENNHQSEPSEVMKEKTV